MSSVDFTLNSLLNGGLEEGADFITGEFVTEYLAWMLLGALAISFAYVSYKLIKRALNKA